MSKTLNDWERNFMKSIDGRKKLSPKQRIVRDKINMKLDEPWIVSRGADDSLGLDPAEPIIFRDN